MTTMLEVQIPSTRRTDRRPHYWATFGWAANEAEAQELRAAAPGRTRTIEVRWT